MATGERKMTTRGNKSSPPRANTPLHNRGKESVSPLPAHWVQLLEKRMAKVEESLFERLSAKIKSSEERLMEKFSEVSVELTNVKKNIKLLDVRLTAVETSCEVIAALTAEVGALRKEAAVNENKTVATDFIISGIPKAGNENYAQIFSNICKAVGGEIPAVREIFRAPAKSENKQSNSPPIIVVKLFSPYARSQLFKAIAGFCRTKKRALNLNDIGVDGAASIHIHESLSRENRKLMLYAAQLKRNKMLAAAFSIRGHVHIRKREGDEAIRVIDKKSIDEIVSSN